MRVFILRQNFKKILLIMIFFVLFFFIFLDQLNNDLVN